MTSTRSIFPVIDTVILLVLNRGVDPVRCFRGPLHIGPSFECAQAIRPLEVMLCADVMLSRTDLRFNQAYWALYHQVGAAGRTSLKQDDLDFLNSVHDRCGIPRSGGAPND